MKGFTTVAFLIAFAANVAPLLAQWPSRPAPGVPRLANGKPDLDAPTPKTPDGKPDLTGNWDVVLTPADRILVGVVGGTPAPKDAPPPPTVSLDQVATDHSSGFKGGLPLRPWAAELVKKRVADHSKDNPEAHCLPAGIVQFHSIPTLRQFVQTPGLILIIYETEYGLRQIHTDGRSLPKGEPDPWWYGYSVGRWEGDTLVVESTGFTDDGWLDIAGNPLTSAGRVTERFRRINYGHMEIDVTIDDPKAYTRPWTVRVQQRLNPDTELMESICFDKDAAHYVGAN
jgi:hypothetical protein